MIDKKIIRRELLDKRSEYAREFGEVSSINICEYVINHEEYLKADYILCYLDYHDEVCIKTLINDAISKGKKVFVPKVNSNSEIPQMDFFRFKSCEDVTLGYKGIREPVEGLEQFIYTEYSQQKGIIICPGVGFDKKGFRLGYGKGFYDRFLCDKSYLYKLGICYSCQLTESLQVNEYDIPMDMIVTENGYLESEY